MSSDNADRVSSVPHPPTSLRWILTFVPKLFEFAEWLLVIVAFQYVGARFDSVAVNIVWIILSGALTVYVVAVLSSIVWRATSNVRAGLFVAIITPILLSAVMSGVLYFLFRLVVDQVVAGQR
jgi:hypothetical protein